MSSETKDLESLAMKKQERKKVSRNISGIEKVAKRNSPVCSLGFNFAIYRKQIGVSVIHEILFGVA